MGTVVALDAMLSGGRVWRGRLVEALPAPTQPTGFAVLDAVLPSGGWPEHALSEVLFRADGNGELSLVFPTLARLTQAGGRIAVVAPPYRPHAPAWARAGIELKQVHVVQATPRDALWATEQCLRSAACAAVLCWPRQVDDKSLRRLQVAAGAGQCLGFAFRDARQAQNPSPAAVRLQVDGDGVRVLKCRGGHPPARPLRLSLDS